MKTLRFILITLLCCACYLPVAKAAKKAPHFSAPTLSGPELAFEAQAPALLIFWASWCGSCLAEIPKLKGLNDKWGRAIQFIGVNVNKHPKDGAKTAQVYAIPYPSVSDPALEIADQFNVQGTPTLIAVDRHGHIIYQTHRVDKKLADTLEALTF